MSRLHTKLPVHRSVQRIVLASTIGFLAISGVAGAFFLRDFQLSQSLQIEQDIAAARRLEQSERELQALREDVAILRKDASASTLRALNDAARLRSELARESAERVALTSQTLRDRVAAEQQISELKTKVAQSSFDVASIIATWRPRVVFVRCEWQSPTTQQVVLLKTGSGLLTRDSNGPVVYTNSHVLLNSNNQGPTSCTVRSSIDGATLTIDPSMLFKNTAADLGTIRLSSVTQSLVTPAETRAPVCTSRASVGDEIVILGYPAIGSQNDVTATNGIISGYDRDFYITSAKVEQGNSGGAAILLKDNCYLGIPTFVQLGNIEALARILDIRMFLQYAL